MDSTFGFVIDTSGDNDNKVDEATSGQNNNSQGMLRSYFRNKKS